MMNEVFTSQACHRAVVTAAPGPFLRSMHYIVRHSMSASRTAKKSYTGTVRVLCQRTKTWYMEGTPRMDGVCRAIPYCPALHGS